MIKRVGIIVSVNKRDKILDVLICKVHPIGLYALQAFLLLCTLLWISPTFSTVARRATIQSLTDQAQLIVRGEVISVYTPSKRGPQGQIYTRVELKVDKYLKGSGEYLKGSGEEKIVIQLLGGTIDDLTMHVEGSPVFKTSQKVIVFLTVDPIQPLTYVVSLAQGVYYIDQGDEEEILVKQDLEGLSFYDTVPDPQATPLRIEKSIFFTEPRPQPLLTLSTLEAQIRTALSHQEHGLMNSPIRPHLLETQVPVRGNQ